jgi:hypothetical protein
MNIRPIASAAIMALVSAAAGAQSVTYTFDLPATGLESVNPPYPAVATLTITNIAGGVEFTLDPNESSSGYEGNPQNSFMERITIAYNPVGTPDPSTGLSLVNVSGAVLQGFQYYSPPPDGMDAGYQSAYSTLLFDWYSTPSDGGLRLDATETSTWRLLGTGLDISDFTTAFATANNKPSPIFGVISVTAYDLDGLHPTPSNWVAGQVPEPQTYALMLAGLGVAWFIARKRRK